MATYDSLVQDTPIWLYAQNRDIVDEMPKLISDAEDQIFEHIDHDLFQTVLTGKQIIANNPDLDLTADNVREIRAVRLAWRSAYEFTPLERRELEFLTMLYNSNKPDRPRYYSAYGNLNVIRVFPLPRETYNLEVTVNLHPEKLSPTVQTNILSETFPRVYERAVLRQGAIFMKNPGDAQTYEKEMKDAIGEANIIIARRRRDETGQRAVETSNQAGM